MPPRDRITPSSRSTPQAQTVRTAIVDVFDQTPGLRRSDMLSHLLRFLRAKRVITASHDGEITDIMHVEDYGTQLNAWKEAMTLRNEYPAKNVAVDASFRVEQLNDKVMELERLESEGAIGRGDLLRIAGLVDAAESPAVPKPPDRDE